VQLTRRDDYRKALTLFEQALRLRPSEPRFQSYVGLCLAVTGKKVRAAVELCERAARAEFFRADHFCNLGAVYEVAGDRRKAYDAYQHGLELDRNHAGIKGALRKMGRRRQPVFPFLPRTSAMNRMAGMVLCRLGLR
jgi:Flp pilus assembly protein TadD